MATDRELLIFAAKAAGINYHCIDDKGLWWSPSPSYGRISYRWNPLTDYGDALWLAVKLGTMQLDDLIVQYSDLDFQDDPMGATCRAIVRAAAAIGKAMP
jgi:hypothetical protein